MARSTDDVPVGELRALHRASQLAAAHPARSQPTWQADPKVQRDMRCISRFPSRWSRTKLDASLQRDGNGTYRAVRTHVWRLPARCKIAVTAARTGRVRLYASRSCIIPKPSLTSASRAHGSFVTGRNPRSPGGTYTHGVGSHGRA